MCVGIVTVKQHSAPTLFRLSCLSLPQSVFVVSAQKQQLTLIVLTLLQHRLCSLTAFIHLTIATLQDASRRRVFGFYSAAPPVRLQLEPKAIGGNCHPVSTVTCCTVAPSEVNGHMAVADMDRAPVSCSRTGNKHETHTLNKMLNIECMQSARKPLEMSGNCCGCVQR